MNLPLLSVLLLSALFCSGCSEKKEASWYDDSASITKNRDDYIKDQVDAGVDAKEARDIYELNTTIRRSWTREPVVSEGDELKDMISDP